MSLGDTFSDNNIALTIPIHIGYKAIDDYVRKNFIGEIISKEDSKGKESKYAKILDISLTKSKKADFDILIKVKLETLTVLFRNRTVEALINAKMTFDPIVQLVSIESFEIDSKGKNWLADQLMESIVNRFMYDRLKSRLKFDLKPKLEEQLNTINQKMEHRVEAQDGVFIVGSINKLVISKLEARENGIWIFLMLDGWGIVEVEEITIDSLD